MDVALFKKGTSLSPHCIKKASNHTRPASYSTRIALRSTKTVPHTTFLAGTSDPYVKFKEGKGVNIITGGKETSVIKKNLNPKWGHVFKRQFDHKLKDFSFKVCVCVLVCVCVCERERVCVCIYSQSAKCCSQSANYCYCHKHC
jgi:hypothetical protein